MRHRFVADRPEGSDKPDLSASAGPRWARRKDARPAEIIASALAAFSEHGYAATRIEDIATRAGVTKGTVYLYFKSKEDLFGAVIQNTLAHTIVVGEEMLENYEGTTAELMREMAALVWKTFDDTGAGAIPKLVMAESKKFPEVARLYYHTVVEPSRALHRRIIERGISRGEFRAVDPDEYKSLLLAPAIFLLLWRHTFEHAVPDAVLVPHQVLGTYVDMVLRTLSIGPVPEPTK
jgi:AcrR family transcriptional regulator